MGFCALMWKKVGEKKVLRTWSAVLLGIIVALLVFLPTALFAVAAETTVASGLTGSTQVNLGAEVVIYSIGLTEAAFPTPCATRVGNGALLGVELTISDLTAPTGLVAADFANLNLYRSTDNTFSTGDLLLGTQPVVNVGATTTVDATGALVANRTLTEGAEDFLFVTATIAAGATAGHTLRVGAAVSRVGLTNTNGVCGAANYARGTAVVAADGNNIVIAAQSPSFTSGVAGGGRGIPFGGEPVILIVLLGSGLYMIRRASR
jgi:hypothetical protein